MSALAAAYVFAVFGTLILGKSDKRQEVGIVSIVVGTALAVLVLQVWGILIFIILKLIVFIAVKFKVAILQKIILFVIGSLIPVLQYLVWIFVALVVLGSILEVYQSIFLWLRRKLCQVRDFFDRVYLVSPAMRFSIVGEVAIVCGSTVTSVYLALGVAIGTSEVATLVTYITCIALTVWMYRAYRIETDHRNRYSGDGLDYPGPGLLGNNDD